MRRLRRGPPPNSGDRQKPTVAQSTAEILALFAERHKNTIQNKPSPPPVRSKKPDRNICCRCDGKIWGKGDTMEPVVHVKKGEKYEHFPTKTEKVALENKMMHKPPGCSPYTKEPFFVFAEDGRKNLYNKFRILKRKDLRGLDWVKQELITMSQLDVCHVNERTGFERGAVLQLIEHYKSSMTKKDFKEIRDKAKRHDVKREITFYLEQW